MLTLHKPTPLNTLFVVGRPTRTKEQGTNHETLPRYTGHYQFLLTSLVTVSASFQPSLTAR